MKISDFGALGSGENCTAQVQAAIDACAGGGTLVFEPGVYVCGTLFLRSGVEIHLQSGAVLRASPNIADYPEHVHHQRYLNETDLDRCFIYAEDAHHIALTGKGTIDGNGAAFPNAQNSHRPMMIRMLRCAHISLQGLHLINPGAWTTAFLACQSISAQDLTIISRPYNHGNGDGLDFDGCQDVLISNCSFDTSDDCICLQNSFEGTVSENVVVTNCLMTSTWAGMRIGLLNRGDIRDVCVSNIVMHDIGCSGLKIQATEGGTISDMHFFNIQMRNVPRSVFMTLNHFRMGVHSPEQIPFAGELRDITIRGLRHVNDASLPYDENEGIVLLGVPGAPIRDIEIRDVSMVLRGKKGRPSHSFPELTGQRPEYYVFDGQLPGSAVNLRHVKGVTVDRTRVKLHQKETRPLTYMEDAQAVSIDVRPQEA